MIAEVLERRIVFVHPSGLRQIVGRLEAMVLPPAHVGPVEVGGEVFERVALEDLTPRAAVYRVVS